MLLTNFIGAHIELWLGMGRAPLPSAYIPWHLRQAHTNQEMHQLNIPALGGMCVCVCVIAPSKGVAYALVPIQPPSSVSGVGGREQILALSWR